MYRSDDGQIKEGLILVANAIHNLASAIRETLPGLQDVTIKEAAKSFHEKKAEEVKDQAKKIKPEQPLSDVLGVVEFEGRLEAGEPLVEKKKAKVGWPKGKKRGPRKKPIKL